MVEEGAGYRDRFPSTLSSPVTRSWDETERSSLQRRLLARDKHEVIASAASLPNSRKLSRSYLQGPLQALTSVLANCFPDVGSDVESH